MSLIEFSIKYSGVIAIVGAIVGLFDIAFAIIALIKKRKKPSNTNIGNLFSRIKREPVYLVLIISLISLSIILVLAIQLNSVDHHANSAVATASPTQSASATATATPEKVTAMTYTPRSMYLDELSPILERDGNFFSGGWQDAQKFKLDDRAYSHGIGMRISGTEFEEIVDAVDSPNGKYRDDCKQVSIDFALRSKFDSLSFSIGADKSDMRYYGVEDDNGIAQVQIIDPDKNNILFDTGWVDNAYARYNVEISMLNIEKLEIIYRTCGIPGKSMEFGLQFAMVNPILTLVED
jgi:hypothetical protein